jgi:hypothetical protein
VGSAFAQSKTKQILVPILDGHPQQGFGLGNGSGHGMIIASRRHTCRQNAGNVEKLLDPVPERGKLGGAMYAGKYAGEKEPSDDQAEREWEWNGRRDP